METLKRNKKLIALAAALLLLLTIPLFAFTPTKASAEEANPDDGIVTYGADTLKSSLWISEKEFKYECDGDNLLWPYSDNVDYYFESVDGLAFSSHIEVTFYYHGEFGDQHKYVRGYKHTGFGGGDGASNYRGEINAIGSGAAKKYNVQDCAVVVTFTYNGVTKSTGTMWLNIENQTMEDDRP